MEMRRGTIRPNSAKIIRLREVKGWTQEDLAKNSSISKRTIENVEAGKPAIPFTLHRLAAALEVDYAKIIVRHSPFAAPSEGDSIVEVKEESNGKAGSDSDSFADVVITLNKDFDTYTEVEQEKLLRAIAELLGLKTTVKVLNKWRGSVILQVRLQKDQAEKLATAIREGKFEEFGVIDVTVHHLSEPLSHSSKTESASKSHKMAEDIIRVPLRLRIALVFHFILVLVCGILFGIRPGIGTFFLFRIILSAWVGVTGFLLAHVSCVGVSSTGKKWLAAITGLILFILTYVLLPRISLDSLLDGRLFK